MVNTRLDMVCNFSGCFIYVDLRAGWQARQASFTILMTTKYEEEENYYALVRTKMIFFGVLSQFKFIFCEVQVYKYTRLIYIDICI